jgi:hypothetical protein
MIEYKSCPKTYTNLFIEKILTFNNTSTVFDELFVSIWDLTVANEKHHCRNALQRNIKIKLYAKM